MNIKNFIHNYNHSKLVECTKQIELVEDNVAYNHRNLKILSGLYYLTQIIESNNRNYSLSSGTLLGNLFFNNTVFPCDMVHRLIYVS